MRFLIIFLIPATLLAQSEKDSYRLTDLYESITISNSRSETFKPGKHIPIEITGMAFMPDGRLMTSIRRGELWIIEALNALNVLFFIFVERLFVSVFCYFL